MSNLNQKEMAEVALRLSRGLCPAGSTKLAPSTAVLARTWSEEAFAPMPDRIAALAAQLEAKLAANRAS